MLSVASAHMALPVSLLRYAWHGAGSAQGGQPPPGDITGTVHGILPGGAALARAYRQSDPVG